MFFSKESKSREATKMSLAKYLVLILCFITHSIFASQIIEIDKVVGEVFLHYKDKTKILSSGDFVHDMSEIITEEGSSVIFRDYFDHKFQLAGGSHVKFMNRIIDLKRGYLYLQSFNYDKEISLQTANSQTLIKDGEVILSFDSFDGKSQLLVLTGEAEFSTLLQDELKVTVESGKFSFVDNEKKEEGPRTPTEVGQSSFKKATSLFEGIYDKFEGKVKESKRTIASIDETTTKQKAYLRGIPKVATGANKNIDIDSFYKNKIQTELKSMPKVPKSFVPNYSTKSNVVIKIYGKKIATQVIKNNVNNHLSTNTKSTKMTTQIKKGQGRSLASIGSLNSSISPTAANPIGVDDSFEKGLVEQYKNQMKHSNEVNQLIDELQSYKKNYDKSY